MATGRRKYAFLDPCVIVFFSGCDMYENFFDKHNFLGKFDLTSDIAIF